LVECEVDPAKRLHVDVAEAVSLLQVRNLDYSSGLQRESIYERLRLRPEYLPFESAPKALKL